MRVVGSKVVMVAAGLLSAAAVVAPSTARAATTSTPSAQSATTASQAIAEAQMEGQPGTLMHYQASTNSWTQVATIGNPQAASEGDTLAEPAVSWTPRVACLLVSFTIGACSDVAVTYKDVVPTKAATIIKSLETIDGDEANEMREGSNEVQKQREILEGDNSESGTSAEGGYSDGAAGAEDSAVDFGGGYTDIIIDVLEIGFL